MHLVIFDIDGTLIHSHSKEVDCFEQALANVTGITGIDKDLANYDHVSDRGIANQCILKALHRTATEQEQIEIENEFIRIFANILDETPPTPIPGVHELFESLLQQNDYALAIATGCYFRSAALKFKHAALPIAHLPIGSSNDSAIRTDIMQAAHLRAMSTYRLSEFKSITYIGDGPWDIRAVSRLKWGFIGIASNYTEDTLRLLGAKHTLKDYACQDTFFKHLDTLVT